MRAIPIGYTVHAGRKSNPCAQKETKKNNFSIDEISSDQRTKMCSLTWPQSFGLCGVIIWLPDWAYLIPHRLFSCFLSIFSFVFFFLVPNCCSRRKVRHLLRVLCLNFEFFPFKEGRWGNWFECRVMTGGVRRLGDSFFFSFFWLSVRMNQLKRPKYFSLVFSELIS